MVGFPVDDVIPPVELKNQIDKSFHEAVHRPEPEIADALRKGFGACPAGWASAVVAASASSSGCDVQPAPKVSTVSDIATLANARFAAALLRMRGLADLGDDLRRHRAEHGLRRAAGFGIGQRDSRTPP